jgi:hypothetical protein
MGIRVSSLERRRFEDLHEVKQITEEHVHQEQECGDQNMKPITTLVDPISSRRLVQLTFFISLSVCDEEVDDGWLVDKVPRHQSGDDQNDVTTRHTNPGRGLPLTRNASTAAIVPDEVRAEREDEERATAVQRRVQ